MMDHNRLKVPSLYLYLMFSDEPVQPHHPFQQGCSDFAAAQFAVTVHIPTLIGCTAVSAIDEAGSSAIIQKADLRKIETVLESLSAS